VDFWPRPGHAPESGGNYERPCSEAFGREFEHSLLVYYDGENYFLKDGFQRVEATLRLGRKTILAEVIPGTRAGMAAEWKRFLAALKVTLTNPAAKQVEPRLEQVSNY
jgi:hypothetical protein